MSKLTMLRPRVAASSLTKVKIEDRHNKAAPPFYLSLEWRRLVAEIKRERGSACQKCGASGVRIFGDHIVEIADGGDRLDPKNLQLLCGRCHGGKTAAERVKRLGKHSATGPVEGISQARGVESSNLDRPRAPHKLSRMEKIPKNGRSKPRSTPSYINIALRALADVAGKAESEHARVAASKALLAFAVAGAAGAASQLGKKERADLDAQIPDTETHMGALMARRSGGK